MVASKRKRLNKKQRLVVAEKWCSIRITWEEYEREYREDEEEINSSSRNYDKDDFDVPF